MQTVDLVKSLITSEHGWAVAEQFEDTFNDEAFEEQNTNALEYISQSISEIINSNLLSESAQNELKEYQDELVEYLKEWA